MNACCSESMLVGKHLRGIVRGFAGFFIFVVSILTGGSSAWAQISYGGTPASFQYALSSAAPSTTMPTVDVPALVAEDEAEQQAVEPLMPPLRISYGFDVNWNLNNSGTWETLANGTRVWRLRVECPGAQGMYFWFNEWNIPKGGQLFLYNDDHSDVRGAFTHENNWTDGNNATAPMRGTAVTLEYNLAPGVTENGALSIGKVQHVYRRMWGRDDALDNFGDAQSCNININCPEGANWQDEKHAVAMIIDPVAGRYCTGALVRSACDLYDPLFMTADHCLTNQTSNWIFVFNYEAPSCANPQTEPSTAQSVTNCTLLMNWPLDNSDMALMRLSSNVPAAYSPYAAGWDRNNVAQTSSVGIHHTDGDIKKIYGDNNPAVSGAWGGVPNSHWIIEWDYGAMCYGASGSPIFDQNSRTKGPLTGGYPCCSNPGPDNAWYGKISASWNGGGTPQSRLHDWLDPCNSGVTTTDGSYMSVPSNDLCSNALYIGSGTTPFPYSHSSLTTYSNNDYTATSCGNGFPGRDNVYYWVSDCSTSVSLNLCNSNFDTGLYVREGSCDGTQVACDDDACVSPNSLASSLTFNARPGTLYYIFVDGYATNGGGNYTLQMNGTVIGSAPANDHCAGSIAVNSVPYTHSGSTCLATNDRTNCVGPSSNDVFYTLNLATCQTVTVSLCGSTYDTGIEVLTGGACPGTTQVACNDDNYCGADFTLQSTVSFNAVAGENYYIVVHGFSSSKGNYVINVTGVPFGPPNDACPGTSIAALPYTDSGNTLCADATRPNCIGEMARDVYYSYTSPICQSVTASLCGSAYDTRLEVRTGGSCPGDVQMACNDDWCGLQSEITFDAASGQTYYIIINGFVASSYGAYTLNVSGVPGPQGNDLCTNAYFIGGGDLPYESAGNTICAGNEAGNCVGLSSNNVFYRLNIGGANCRYVTVSLCGSGINPLFDTALSIRTDGACPGATLVTCNDDGLTCQSDPWHSIASFNAEPNQDYWIVVHGFSTSAGYYHITVTGDQLCRPDSLVIQPQGNNAYLDWAPLPAGGFYTVTYNVYRATTTVVPIIPANLLASTTNAFYTDVNAFSNPSNIYFYAVTAEAAYLAARENPDGEAIDAVETEKTVSKAQIEAMENIFIPAYIDPADIEGPNPNKPAQ